MRTSRLKRLARALIRFDDACRLFGPLVAYVIGHLATMWLFPGRELLFFVGGTLTYAVYMVLLMVALTIDT